MSQRNIIIFSVVAALLLLFLYNMKQNAYRAFVEQKEQLVTFEKSAKEIGTLKKRFSDKKAVTRTLSSLKRIATPSKEYEKGKKRVLEFDQLSPQKLNALLRKIANSTIEIKDMRITRIDDLHAKVRLEVAK